MELQAILFVLQAYTNPKEIHNFFSLIICFTSTQRFKTDPPLLIQIQNLLHKINVDQKENVFMWAPGHIPGGMGWAHPEKTDSDWCRCLRSLIFC